MGQRSLNLLHRIEDDLTPAQKEKISGCIRTIRPIIATLKVALSLEVHPVPLSRIVTATAGALWVTLVDTEPESLTRYGPVPEEIRTVLGPALEGLIAQVNEMQAIVAQR